MRKVLLSFHLYLGLLSALFLVVLGLTGSIIAFESDIDHWVHPRFWYVSAGGQSLPEGDLVAAVERKFTPARVAGIQVSLHPGIAQMMQLSDGSSVTVNPYTAAILGRWTGPTRVNRWLGYIHQIHLRLAFDGRAPWARAGKTAVDYAGLGLFLLVPTGLFLWLRTRITSVRLRASWFRILFDTHQVIGIYAGLFLWISAFTGILIGFQWGEKAIYGMTHSSRPAFSRPRPSTPVSGAAPVGIDRAIEVARQAIPGAAVDTLVLPLRPAAAYQVILRVPEETSGSAHSSVTVDQFSGKPLEVHNFLTDSQGYRWIRFNRSIHTGDIGGVLGHIVMSLSSLLLVAMVITGLVIWLKKLAV